MVTPAALALLIINKYGEDYARRFCAAVRANPRLWAVQYIRDLIMTIEWDIDPDEDRWSEETASVHRAV